MTEYLSIKQVLALHLALARRFGGAVTVRDRGALEAAIARPAMTYGGDDLYGDLPAKAAALMHSLVLNHPFVDGNRRAGAGSAELFLMVNGWALVASDLDIEALTFDVAKGEVEVEALAIWFRQRLRPLP